METINIAGFSDPISSWTHLSAALFFLIASFRLIYKGRGNTGRVTSLVIYSFSLVFLFSMSGTFHMLEHAGDARGVLQRLDHSGIWVLIAGSFTPIHVVLFRGRWRWLVLSVVWLIAINGLIFEVIFFKNFPEWLALSFFLGLGWMGSLTAMKFHRSYKGESLFLFFAGGLFYSLGAIMDFTRTPVIIDGYLGPHEIFHIFVILGAVSHWLFIWKWADHPVHNLISFEIRVFKDGRFIGEAVADHIKVEAKSLLELKNGIQLAVAKKYHPSIKPEVHLRYFDHEVLNF